MGSSALRTAGGGDSRVQQASLFQIGRRLQDLDHSIRAPKPPADRLQVAMDDLIAEQGPNRRRVYDSLNSRACLR